MPLCTSSRPIIGVCDRFRIRAPHCSGRRWPRGSSAFQVRFPVPMKGWFPERPPILSALVSIVRSLARLWPTPWLRCLPYCGVALAWQSPAPSVYFARLRLPRLRMWGTLPAISLRQQIRGTHTRSESGHKRHFRRETLRYIGAHTISRDSHVYAAGNPTYRA